jgi:hypothetical protein
MRGAIPFLLVGQAWGAKVSKPIWDGTVLAAMRIASTNRLSSGLIHSRQTAEAATRASRAVAINRRARQIENPGGGGRGFRVDEQGENSIVQELSYSIAQ